MPSELDDIPAYHLSEWAGFERVFGPLTVQERVDWAAAEIVALLAGEKKIDKALLRWDDRSEFQSEAQEAVNAMKLESMLKGLATQGRKEPDGNGL